MSSVCFGTSSSSAVERSSRRLRRYLPPSLLLRGNGCSECVDIAPSISFFRPAVAFRCVEALATSYLCCNESLATSSVQSTSALFVCQSSGRVANVLS